MNWEPRYWYLVAAAVIFVVVLVLLSACGAQEPEGGRAEQGKERCD